MPARAYQHTVTLKAKRQSGHSEGTQETTRGRPLRRATYCFCFLRLLRIPFAAGGEPPLGASSVRHHERSRTGGTTSLAPDTYGGGVQVARYSGSKRLDSMSGTVLAIPATCTCAEGL